MTLNRISDVRQHIKRRHTLPSFCPCCGCTFSDDPRYLKRDAHMRACKVNTGFSQLCGMTPDQLREMTAAGRRQQNDPERWYEIWGIMFPHRARPPSPYINTEHELRRIGAHAAVRQYLNEGRLQAFMEQRLWGFPLVEVTLRDLLQDLLDSYDMG
ncbi:hypothetical protein F4777DRAFT_552450 [Nemania sp. FL0916]|nr:hypothetical protein F4777DRAFT_552450 [Nemania sp. FL0916]